MERQIFGWIAWIAEGICPVCKVKLVIHHGIACCPCGGCAYELDNDQLRMTGCKDHNKTCVHWESIWTQIRNQVAER